MSIKTLPEFTRLLERFEAQVAGEAIGQATDEPAKSADLYLALVHAYDDLYTAWGGGA